ncbi:DivIVA domain-containing protein [Eubacteriales bacterium KG127]
MISPIDIEKKDFSKAFNGYNKEEVDSFLNFIIFDIENYQRTISELKTESESLKEQMSEYRQQQGNLSETLTSAKTLLSDISDSAEKRAALIISNAEKEAEFIVKDAKLSVLNANRELETLKNKINYFRERYIKMLEAELGSFSDDSSIFLDEIEQGFTQESYLNEIDEDIRKVGKSSENTSTIKSILRSDFVPSKDKRETKVL